MRAPSISTVIMQKPLTKAMLVMIARGNIRFCFLLKGFFQSQGTLGDSKLAPKVSN